MHDAFSIPGHWSSAQRLLIEVKYMLSIVPGSFSHQSKDYGNTVTLFTDIITV